MAEKPADSCENCVNGPSVHARCTACKASLCYGCLYSIGEDSRPVCELCYDDDYKRRWIIAHDQYDEEFYRD